MLFNPFRRSVSFAPGTKPPAETENSSVKSTSTPSKAPQRVRFGPGTKPPAEDKPSPAISTTMPSKAAKSSVSSALGNNTPAETKSSPAKSTTMPSNAPKRSVSYAPGTKPPAEDKNIEFVPQAVEWLRAVVWLRKCKVFIPAQLFDLINLRLAPNYCPNRDCQVSLFHQRVYTQPPYTALIHDLAYVNSFPLTPQMIAEIQEMRTRPSAPHPANTFQSPTNRWIGPEFNAINSESIAAQRQVDSGAEKGRSVPKSNTPQTVDQGAEKSRSVPELKKKTVQQAKELKEKTIQHAKQVKEEAQQDKQAARLQHMEFLAMQERFRLLVDLCRANSASQTA